MAVVSKTVQPKGNRLTASVDGKARRIAPSPFDRADVLLRRDGGNQGDEHAPCSVRVRPPPRTSKASKVSALVVFPTRFSETVGLKALGQSDALGV